MGKEVFLDILSKVEKAAAAVEQTTTKSKSDQQILQEEEKEEAKTSQKRAQISAGGASGSDSDNEELQAYEYYSTWKARKKSASGSSSGSGSFSVFSIFLVLAAVVLATAFGYYYQYHTSYTEEVSIYYSYFIMTSDSSVSSSNGLTKAVIKATATTLIMAGTAFAIWRIMSSDFSSSSSPARGLRATPKKKKKKQDAKNVHIYYGSQTGTAETFSNEIKKGCEKMLDEKAQVWDMEDFEVDEFRKQKVVVMCLATYGEGDPTDNAVDFHEWLISEQDTECLKGMKYAIFGLGNTQYVNFNSMGKIADSHLERLGAERMYDLGLGNDDADIEADFDSWTPELFPAIGNALISSNLRSKDAKMTRSVSMTEEKPVLPLIMHVKEERNDLPLDPTVKNGGNDVLSKALFQATKATVIEKRELKQQPDYENGLSCIHVDLAIDPAKLTYKTADNMDITAPNPDHVVKFWADFFKISDRLDEFVGFTKSPTAEALTIKKPFQTPSRLSWVLKQCCDLQFLPSRGTMKTFTSYVKQDGRRNAMFKLLENNQFYQKLQGLKMTFVECWMCFYHDLDIELGDFLQIIARPKARAMTIASSNLEDNKKVGLCIAMLKETAGELPLKDFVNLGIMPSNSPHAEALEKANKARKYSGIASTWACTWGLNPGDTCLITNHASSLRLPRSAACPVIMIAAGSGIAPMRAFWREFRHLKSQNRTAILFFGCRHSEKDYLYKDEIQQMLDEGVLTEVVTAFSREDPNKKVYVQDRLRERKEDIQKWINNKGYFFLCGSTAMGNAVVDIISEFTDIKALRNEKRFVEELFG